MRPRLFQISYSRSLPAKSLMELRWVLEVVSVVDGVPVVVDGVLVVLEVFSVVHGVPVVVDAADGVLYGVHTK